MFAITDQPVDLIFAVIGTVIVLAWALWPSKHGTNCSCMSCTDPLMDMLRTERARAAGARRRARRKARWAPWLNR